jgi:serine/threonine protein kinase
VTEVIGRRCRHCGAGLLAEDVFCGHCGGSAEIPVTAKDPIFASVSDLFRGELELEREIGRGGMAAVFLAFDPALQRRVAVKALLPEFAEDPAMAERFVREARTVAALQHPHVVSIFGVRAGRGAQAIVMEFVEGRSLDVVLAERGRMHLGVSALVLSQVAAGLLHAHERGVVHRDVKPANVILDRDGRAVVSDFGIARRHGMPRITGTGRVVGTLAYMSPEQRTGLEATPAADQYAFGVMAFELLTGRLPFLGSAAEINTAHLVDDPPTPRSLRPEIPLAVENMVLRMLAKEPKDRFRTLRDAERGLRSLVPDAASTTVIIADLSRALPETGSAVFDAITSPITVPSIPAPPPRLRRRWPVQSTVIAAVVMIAVLVVWRISIASRARPTPPTQVAALATDVHTPAPVSDPGLAPPPSGPAAKPSAAQSRVAETQKQSPRSVLIATDTPAASIPKPPDTRQGESPAREVAAEAPPPRPDSAPRSASAAPSATIADARLVGREFVTLLNQRQWADVDRLAAAGRSEPALREELVRLTRSAADFGAGFDRIPSAPVAVPDGFDTEFIVDLAWRGGHKLIFVRAQATAAAAGWHLAGVVITPAY